MNNFFTYDSLKSLLVTMKKIAPIKPFGEWEGENGIILAHDIDYSIRKAYRIYELERALGIRSTFFVLTTAPVYNVLHPANRRMLVEMSDSGFEIGLHFDISVYPDKTKESLQTEVDREATILDQILGRKAVNSICIHNPGAEGLFPSFRGYKNTCDFYAKDRVLKDSRKHLDKNPFEFIKRGKEEVIALWLHPVHYSEEGKEGYAEIIEEDNECVLREIHEYASTNKVYLMQMEGEDLIQYIGRRGKG